MSYILEHKGIEKYCTQTYIEGLGDEKQVWVRVGEGRSNRVGGRGN